MSSNILLNETVAIFHKYGEDGNGKAMYKVYKLTNVRLENRNSVYSSNRGLKPYDGFKLYFSTEHSMAQNESEERLEFISPATWDSLDETEKKNFWTVSEHDLISRHTEAFSENMSLNEMKNRDDFYYVNSAIPCRSRGKIKLIEITGRGRSLDSE